MFNIDKSLKNIMGKTNTNFNSKQSLPTFKPIQTNVSMNMLSNVNSKPASPRMQMQWKSFSTPVKNQMRMKYKDSDGDRIPNRWDCNPNNPFQTSRFKEQPYTEKIKLSRPTEHYRSREEMERGVKPYKTTSVNNWRKVEKRPSTAPIIFKNPEGQTIKVSPGYLRHNIVDDEHKNEIIDTVSYLVDTMPKAYLHKKSNIFLTTPEEYNKKEFLRQAHIELGGRINYENLDKAQQIKQQIIQERSDTIAQHQTLNKPGATVSFNRTREGDLNPQIIRKQKGENIIFLNMPEDSQRLKKVMFHEVGHGISKRYPEVKEEYKHTKKKYGLPTSSVYGDTNEEEDFAEAFAISHKDVGTIHTRPKFEYYTDLADQLKNESFEGTFGHVKRSESPLDIDIRTQSPAHLIHTANWSNIPNKAEQPILQPEGASLEKQQEWQNMPQEQKVVMNNMLSDRDGDNVPDQYDCEPLNPNKQEQDDSDEIGYKITPSTKEYNALKRGGYKYSVRHQRWLTPQQKKYLDKQGGY